MIKKVTFLNSVFRILLVTLFFNMIVILGFLHLILQTFSTSNQSNTFKVLYEDFVEMESIDQYSESFQKVVKIANGNDCSIEVYDIESNVKIYPTYPKIDLSGINTRELFYGVLGESDVTVIKDSISERDYFFQLNGKSNQLSMVIKKDNLIILVQTIANAYKGYYTVGSRTIILSFFISFIVACFMSIVFSNNVFDDIKEIKRVSEKMARQDFSEKCNAKSNEELSSVADAMNTMAFSLQKHIQDSERVSKVLREDISNKEKMEQSQKDFVSNVSHELKTPISIISGYTEGIKYGLVTEESEIKKYCDTILNECNRMTNIVKRLLTLSSMENERELNITKVNISKTISVMIDKYYVKHPKRNFVVLVEDDLLALCDEEEIEHVIMNYIDNAIKYSSDKITISAYNADDYIYIGVESIGSHISEEEESKIWNRFYRIDKSHQRDKNEMSSGLGLSIVKATMEKHQYPYGVNNTQDGVEFYILLKNANNNI